MYGKQGRRRLFYHRKANILNRTVKTKVEKYSVPKVSKIESATEEFLLKRRCTSLLLQLKFNNYCSHFQLLGLSAFSLIWRHCVVHKTTIFYATYLQSSRPTVTA